MASTVGIYRIACGARIVQSTFDFETGTIGPIVTPLRLACIESETFNKFPLYKFYQAMLADETALAVFNVNNYCLCVITRNGAYEVAATDTPKLELAQWSFREPLKLPIYEHIGYIKSHHDCLAVSQYPTFLLREVGSNKAVDFETPIVGNPTIKPKLALYKELIQTEAVAIYFDESTQQSKLLYK